LSIIGYWTVIHIVVVVEEHLIFRGNRWNRYDLDAWGKEDMLPFGWGAIGAFCFGFLGAALGMKVTCKQHWVFVHVLPHHLQFHLMYSILLRTLSKKGNKTPNPS
jgi:purine-cytosine permease-like protein